MNRRLALALVMSGAVSVCMSAQSTPEKVDPWVPIPGVRTSTDLDALIVRHGVVRTNRLYSDFVFTVEFQLVEQRSHGSIMVRSRFGYGGRATSVRGLRVALTGEVDGKEALGRMRAADTHVKENTFAPAQFVRPPGEWQECEIRAERDTITVKVNGVLVSTNQSSDDFAGYLALETTSNSGIAFRNLRAIRLPHAHDPFGQNAHQPSEPGVALPQQLTTDRPFYPKEAFEANIQGTVGLVVVVRADGSVGDIRVTKPLEPNLDEAAIDSARKWRFKPGTKDGQPVDVIVRLDISFSRRK